jgi:hypothetical protein
MADGGPVTDQGQRSDQETHPLHSRAHRCTQAEIVDRAVAEYAARHADTIQAGIERARSVLAGGETAIAAHLLDVPAEDVERVAGKRGNRAGPA